MSRPPLTYGSIENMDIATLVAEHPVLLERFERVLVTSLDSSHPTELRKVLQALEAYAGRVRVIGTGVTLSGRDLIRVTHEYELFTHFDEVWLFRGEPVTAKPEGVGILGLHDLSKGLPEVLVDWMRLSACVGGLGDGIRLNYVVTEGPLARCLSACR